MTSIAVDPTNPQIIYAGGTGVVLKTTDGGAHWTETSTGIDTWARAISLLVDPASPSTVYLGAADGYNNNGPQPGYSVIYKSLDGGASWAPSVGAGIPLAIGSGIGFAHLALNSQTPTTLYAGTDLGLFESMDGGTTWSVLLGGSSVQSVVYVNSFGLDFQAPKTFYVAAQNGLMKSIDGGVTWTALTNPGGAADVVNIAVDPQHGDILYAAAPAIPNLNAQGGVFASTDGGAHWIAGSLPSSAISVSSLLVDPRVSSRIWAVSTGSTAPARLLVSNDSGATWAFQAGAFPPDSVWALGADASGTIYVATGYSMTPTGVASIHSAATTGIYNANDDNVAPGEIVSLLGGGLASSTAAATSFPLPATLSDAQVSLLIPAVTTKLALPLFVASAGQINAQIPFEAPLGPALAVVNRSAGGQADLPIQIVPAAPTIFTMNGQGTGPGAIEHGLTYQIVNDASPAAPGEFISVYCTGLGAVSPSVPTGDVWKTASQTVIPVQVSIAGTDAQVWYAGVTPGYTGLYQVNVQIPDGTPAGAEPLIITENGVASNTVTVAVQ